MVKKVFDGIIYLYCWKHFIVALLAALWLFETKFHLVDLNKTNGRAGHKSHRIETISC